MTVAVTALAALAALVPAHPAGAEATVQVEAGINGYSDPGEHLVVRVAVTADELIDGEIVVAHAQSATPTRQGLQVPAGTTKEIVFVVAVATAGRIDVEVRHGDDVVASGRTNTRNDADVELVGLLPRLVARLDDVPEQATLDNDLGRAELAVLPLDVIDLGPVALESYDTIVAAGDDLPALDDTQQRTLLLWVNSGGRLLLDDASALDALPQPWQPADGSTYAWAGRGEIRIVDGAASAGQWASMIEPSGAASERMGMTDVFVDPQQELAERSGVRLPSLLPLIVVLAVYGVVIGPIVYLALRRSRRLTLGWVVIPVVALLTTGAVVAAGGRFRGSGEPATATFVDTSEVGAVALANVLTFSRSGGEQPIDVPDGWQLDQSSFQVWGAPTTTSDTFVVAPDGSGRLDQRLESGQVATNGFAGEVPAQPISVSAELVDGEITGTVTNDTDVVLHDVAVFAGNDATSVGTVAPGASAAWAVDAPSDIGVWLGRSENVWTPPFFGDQRPSEQLAEFGIFGLASIKWEMYPSGMARVVGWSDDLAAPISVGDDASSLMAISATTPIRAPGAPPTVATVRATVVRSPFGGGGMGMDMTQVYRYLVAPDAEPGADLVLDGLDDGVFGDVAFWDGSTWVAGNLDEPNVPATAVRDGVVLVRTELTGMGEPATVPTLIAAEAQ